MQEINLRINGLRVTCPEGSSLLEAAVRNGISIPRLCYHHELTPQGACRLCLVEDEGSGRIMASCVTPAAPDMSILTHSPTVLRHRRNIIRLMMAEHPESCIVCSKGNRCQLRQIAASMGLGETGLDAMPNPKRLEQENPFIVRDLTKCVLCSRCIRADHDLVVAGAIDYHHRGFRSRPATLYDQPLTHSECTFCGTCVSLCPTGALSSAFSDHCGTPEQEGLTPCSFCGVGCSLLLGTVGDRVVEVNPAARPGSVNGVTLCVRGHFAHDYLNARDRLTAPRIRKDGEWSTVSWEEALTTVAEGLVRARKQYGPQSIGFYGSSKCTNEENYLFQRLARAFLGTHNVDNGGTLSGRHALVQVGHILERGGRVRTLSQIEQAEALVVFGSNVCHSAPVAGYALKRAARKGIPLVVVDPRPTPLTAWASLWVPLAPGTDAQWITCLSALLWQRFGHDPAFIERHTEGFPDVSHGLSSFNPDRLLLTTQTERETLHKAADLLKGRKILALVGRGVTQQAGGGRTLRALANLLLMTGSPGHPAGGLFVLEAENNGAGAWDMGSVPESLPGRASIKDAQARKAWEHAWNTRLSPDPGLDVFQMIEACERGQLKALYILGENPLRTLPQQDRVRKALQNLDLLVVQDILETETCQAAHVVLPGAALPEKAGSTTNLEGRIQCFSPVVLAPGKARPDWEILDALSARVGPTEPFQSLKRVRAEIGRMVPDYGFLLASPESGWGWVRGPSASSTHQPGTSSPRMPFFPLEPVKGELAEEDYSFQALVGSSLFHLGSGTRTSRSARIDRLGLGGEVEMDQGDAQRLGLSNGDSIRIRSQNGEVVRPVKTSTGLRSGLVFIPKALHDNDVMELFPLERPAPGWAGLKMCSVMIEKVLDAG